MFDDEYQSFEALANFKEEYFEDIIGFDEVPPFEDLDAEELED